VLPGELNLPGVEGDEGGERVPPAVNRIVGVAAGDRPGRLWFVAKQFEVCGAIIVLQAGGDTLRFDLAERGECLVNAILQEQIIRFRELVVVAKHQRLV
jgi:hypothetical protein